MFFLLSFLRFFMLCLEKWFRPATSWTPISQVPVSALVAVFEDLRAKESEAHRQILGLFQMMWCFPTIYNII